MQEQNQKKALPMNFILVRDLKTIVDLNLIVLDAIVFIIRQGLGESDYAGNKVDLAYSVSALLDYWVKNHRTEVSQALDDFENMDMVLIDKAESAIALIDHDGLPDQWRKERLKDALEGIEAILQNPDLPHDRAEQLKAKCEELQQKMRG